jgi:hypothetical protein
MAFASCQMGVDDPHLRYKLFVSIIFNNLIIDFSSLPETLGKLLKKTKLILYLQNFIGNIKCFGIGKNGRDPG